MSKFKSIYKIVIFFWEILAHILPQVYSFSSIFIGTIDDLNLEIGQESCLFHNFARGTRITVHHEE
jgi:hypothetical protein